MCVFVCAKRCLLFTILVGVVCIVWRCMGYYTALEGIFFVLFCFWEYKY